MEIIEGFMGKSRGEDMDLMAILARRIWLRKNTLVFEGLFIPPTKVFSCVAENLQDFTLCQQEGQCGISHQEQDRLSATKVWQPPPPNLIKVNWNAATNIKEGCIGIGIVARDCGGHVLGGKCMYFPMAVEAKIAEAMAAIHAVLFCKEVGFLDVIFESDALQVIREINSKPPYAS